MGCETNLVKFGMTHPAQKQEEASDLHGKLNDVLDRPWRWFFEGRWYFF
jgi:hypothetical protein